MPRQNIYVPDDLLEAIKATDGELNVSAVCQKALREEITRMTTVAEIHDEMRRITLDMDDHNVVFTGRWLVEPDDRGTRAAEDGWDAGTYWGVALGANGGVLVYTAHFNYRAKPTIHTYDKIDDIEGEVPSNIFVGAKAAVGERVTIELDI